MQIPDDPRARKELLATALQDKYDRIRYNRLKNYSPYEKQTEFHNAGYDYTERCLGAGNQLGKTLAGSMEVAMHTTGLYPDDWEGAEFKRPTVWWVGGVTSETIRDTTQKLLVGRIQDPEGLGSGSLPKGSIIEVVRSMGIKDGLDHIKVRHKSGGVSLIFFKSYEKGRDKWQGETIDGVWYDEEPPPEIYSEGKTRTNNGQLGQFTMLTFTPLKGMTAVVYSFYQTPTDAQHLTMMTIDDVDHYSEEEKISIVASYPAHEREARAKGIPILGEGRVYPVMEEDIVIPPIDIPHHWPRINGIDFGWKNQAWVQLAWDRDTDTVYVVKDWKTQQKDPDEQAIVVKKWGKWVPCSWPHDGKKEHEASGNKTKADLFVDAELPMLPDQATHEDGGNSVEAGLIRILQRMNQGRFKVFSTCTKWIDEFRLYHRKDGKIVKVNDHVLDATRYAEMMLRYAEIEPNEEDYDEDDYHSDSAMGY